MTKLNDDIRILVALREGYDVVDEYKEGYGWSNPPAYYRGIEDRAQTVWRNISLSSIDRAVTNGLIEIDRERAGESFGRGHHHRYKLTDAGQAAAVAVDLGIEDALRRPAETTKEERERDRIRAGARKVLKILVEQDKHLESCYRHGETVFWDLVPRSGGWARFRADVAFVAALAPYLESRPVDPRRRMDPGEPGDLQPNAAGIAAITHRKSLKLSTAG